jgi:hypothetical protein
LKGEYNSVIGNTVMKCQELSEKSFMPQIPSVSLRISKKNGRLIRNPIQKRGGVQQSSVESSDVPKKAASKRKQPFEYEDTFSTFEAAKQSEATSKERKKNLPPNAYGLPNDPAVEATKKGSSSKDLPGQKMTSISKSVLSGLKHSTRSAAIEIKKEAKRRI